jgi:hypothetical protein
MSGDKPKLPVTRPDAAYAVGYGKPPVSGRFQKGRSGNPRGRPRGSKNKKPALNEERLKDIVLKEAYRTIKVRDGDRNVSLPMAQAIMRALAVNAAKGQHRAQRLFSEMLTRTESQNKALADEWLETAINYKIDWEQELHRRERLNITNLPPPLPHPDQVKIDMQRGTARIQGPATRDEAEELDLWTRRRDAWQTDLDHLRRDLEAETDPGTREQILDDIRACEKILDIANQLLDRIGY